jgi:hypothetical protein
MATCVVKFERKHGMLPGSHERHGGPECRCGAAWLYFEDRCAASAKTGEQPS